MPVTKNSVPKKQIGVRQGKRIMIIHPVVVEKIHPVEVERILDRGALVWYNLRSK